MNYRITGFDLARSYAIFGMLIVNFSFSFGSFSGTSPLAKFQFLFIGNATSIFIILAGIGVSLMTHRNDYSELDKKKIKKTILKRSWFLFGLGLLLYSWWPGDILHFYGGYLHVAAFILFLSKHYYLKGALISLIIYHILLLIIPVETGWNYTTTEYVDFWTPTGFLRNTLYNGWNSIFPWISFFLFGMWLGKLDWNNKIVKRRLFIVALIVFLLFKGLKIAASYALFDASVNSYMLIEYSPIVIPFIMITASCAIFALLISLYVANKFHTYKIIQYLITTGKMSLTMYVFHLTVGMIILSKISGQPYTGFYAVGKTASPLYIMIYVLTFYTISVFLCVLWSKYFKKGPIEILMRKFSND